MRSDNVSVHCSSPKSPAVAAILDNVLAWPSILYTVVSSTYPVSSGSFRSPRCTMTVSKVLRFEGYNVVGVLLSNRLYSDSLFSYENRGILRVLSEFHSKQWEALLQTVKFDSWKEANIRKSLWNLNCWKFQGATHWSRLVICRLGKVIARIVKTRRYIYCYQSSNSWVRRSKLLGEKL